MPHITATPPYNFPPPKGAGAAPERGEDAFQDLLTTVGDTTEDATSAKAGRADADAHRANAAADRAHADADRASAAADRAHADAKTATATERAEADTETETDVSLDEVLEAILGTDTVEAKPESADALAAVVDGLVQLHASLKNGETPDPALLSKLTQAIDTLAGTLGLKLDAMATPDELTAMMTRPSVQGEPIQTQLQKILAPVAQTLTTETDAPDLTALGDKLGALLKALGNAEPEQMMALKPEIDQAVAKLVKLAEGIQPAPTTATTPPPATAPTLADAEVKLAAPSLSLEGTEATDTATQTLTASANAQAGTKDKARDLKPDLATTIAAAAEARSEAKSDVQALGQAGAQQAAKIDVATVAPRPVVPFYQSSQQQLNLPQLAFELVRQVHDGNTRFQIRLNPAELGRIDVKLDIDANGQVNARMIVEKSETLDLMQRDQRALERALQQAGLDGAKTNLEFSLKQNPFGQGSQQGQDGQGNGPLFGGQFAAEAEDGSVPTVNLYRGNLSASGVNILA